MKMRKRRKVINAASRYNNAWLWGIRRLSKLIGEANHKMNMALYEAYSAAREANALHNMNKAAEANGEEL